jgi:hypothetical protein
MVYEQNDSSDKEMKRKNLIEWGLENNKCPACKKDIDEVNGVGTGQFKEGIFCSLDCYIAFYEEDDNLIH